MRNKMSKLLSILLTLVLLCSLAGPLAPSARAEGPYKVGIDDISNGSVTADKDMADEGETVRLTVTPSAGYIIESISVYAIKLHTTVPTTYSEGNYVFTMPASEVQASATFRPAAPSTTEIPSVGLALTLPAAGGSYGGSATASITSGTGFTLTGAKWFNGGTPETNPGCGLAPSSFEAGKPYFAEIYLTAEDGYGFTESTAVTLTGGATVKSTARDHGITTLTIVTNDYTIPAAAATTYTITVNGGKAYKAGGVEITSAAEGDSVYILFDDDAAPAGKYIEWGSAVTEPAVSISAGMISGTEYQAGFIMPAANITVSPDYLDQKSLTVDLTGGTSTDTSAASNAVWSLYRAEDLGLITADISDSHQEKFDLDKDGSWDVTYSTNDSEFSVQDSCSVTGDKTLTIPAAEYSPITFLFKAAAVPYTVDLSTGKMDLATGQEFADLFKSLGAWTHMSSTSGSSTYYYDLDKDGTEDISVTNSSSSRNVLLLTTSNITTDTYVISDSTGPYNPITFILKAPTVTTYPVTLIAYDKTNGTEQAGGEVAFSDSGKGTTISGDYEQNSSRTVGVYPASDYSFAGWAKGSPSGEIVSTSSPYTFTVTEDVTLYALFEKITTYPVWVGGEQVTSANKDDILGDGKAKYDPDSKTLTLDNPTISGPTTQTGVIYAEIDELTITGKATLNLGNAVPNGIEVAGNLIISGAGTDITATGGGNGILAKNITISGGTVNATGCNFGVYADSVFGGNVTISGGSVTAKATGSDSVRYGINGNTVSITGGTVTATSTQYAIGGTDISISGGTVTATGDRYGISQSHEFSITGGTLEATGIEVRAFDFSSITVGEGLDVLVNTEASASGATAWNGTDPLGGQNTVIFKYVKIEPGAEKYPVWVGGEQVTSANKDNIPGVTGGTAKYDPSTQTLTFTGDVTAIEGTYQMGTSWPSKICSEGIDLTLVVNGSLTTGGSISAILVKGGLLTISSGTLNVSGAYSGIYVSGGLRITGGTINATANDSHGVAAINAQGGHIFITGGTVTADGGTYNHGIHAENGDIIISGGTVTADGGSGAVNAYRHNILLGSGMSIVEPVGGTIGTVGMGAGSGAAVLDGTTIAKHAIIEPGEEKYPVWVGGVQVTSANKDDILGDGKAKFDPETNTLTLNSPTVSTNYKGALIYAEGIDLNITGKATLKNENTAYGVLVKDGSLNSDANLTVEVRQYGVSATKSININGGSVNSRTTGHGSDGVGYALGGSDLKISSGTVTATSAQGPAISTTNSVEISGGTVNVTGGFHGISTKSLAISGGTVTVEGDWNGIKAEENITISGGTVAAKSNKSSYKGIYAGGTIEIKNGTACVTADGNSGAIEGSKITLGDALMIQEPTGGKLSGDGKVIQNADDTVAKHAVIVPGTAVTTYPVWVGGVQVTSANKDDILGDGKASFDPDSNTLTLDNPTVSGAYHNAAVYAEVDLTITGSATLSKTILVNAKDLTLDANIVIATPGWDSAIVAGNITVNGGSIIASADEDALLAGSSITINDGSVVGNECDLYAGSITIAGGTVNVSDGLFGIYSKNDITISGGTVTAKGNDYGIYAGGSVTISGGSVTATGSECGISAAHGDVTISGGTVTAKSDTVGIEATNGAIKIQNGTTSVTADGAGAAIGAGGITIGDEMMIKEPAGGFIGDITGSRVIKNPDDTTATHTVIVPKEAATHTVTFEANGGTPVPAAQTVADGGKATKPADPTKSGFVFDGWYADATFSVAFDFSAPITADVTVYAKWKEEAAPGEIVYTIVSGGNSTWTKGSSSGVTIVVKRNVDDDTCFSHFTSVQIGSTTLAGGTDYTAVAGSTVITLNASALQKLTTGTKTVTINFDDGKAATDLTIKAGSSGTGGSTSPKTGDDSKPGLWLAVMMLSGLGIGGLVVNDKKRRYLSRH